MRQIRFLLKRLLKPVLKPAADWYLSRDRSYRYRGMKLWVMPGVFHPGFLISTGLFLDFLADIPLKGKQFLELGAGSGLISVVASRKGADVTASDISSLAIENISRNAKKYAPGIRIIQSDLFDEFPAISFDLIVINPPYYPQEPVKEADFAWYCGPEFEYFHKLFRQLPDHIHPDSELYMILSEDCDSGHIREIAEAAGFEMEVIWRKRKWGEWNFIFRIQKA
jgi:release factor glutamine methyltransferase